MTIRNDCAPLDLFPSEADSGVFDATTGKIASAVPPGHPVGPQGVVAHAFQNTEHERVSFSGGPLADTPGASREIRRGAPTTVRMPARGPTGVVIFTAAALVACLVVAVVWVTVEPIALDRTSPPDEASTAEFFF
jgi:hypothetical protein